MNVSILAQSSPIKEQEKKGTGDGRGKQQQQQKKESETVHRIQTQVTFSAGGGAQGQVRR